ncbi:MAG: response regulator [Epsilonproteobacteria bacterium]|nr:response regulator [Campylobacterota bacterium]
MKNPIQELAEWGKTLKILYVEDDDALRQEIKLFLSDIFEEIDEARNGQEGLDKLSTKTYDLVISDIRMPVMDGIEMIKQIKERYPKQAILVTSAHNEVASLVKLINLDVENFITKPLQGEHILRVLHHVIKRILTEKEYER